MQRRDFLKTTATLAALSSLPTKTLAQGSSWVSKNLTDDWPIARLSDNESSSLDFNGDNIDRPHDILWNIDGYIEKQGGEPKVSEELDVVVVGGGIGGLAGAYYLRHKKIALLEQDYRLGGNTKGEMYKDAIYSIGAAYLAEPDAESQLGILLRELDIHDKARRETGDETTVFYNKKFARPFWEGASADAHADFKKFHARLKQIFNEADFGFESDFAKEYDQMTAEEWVDKEFPNIHPHIKEYMQLYGWSSFCGSIDELSAFQYLGFISSETGALLAYPGGNSYVAQKMAIQIRKDAGKESLRSGCMVLRVKAEGGGATVLYVDGMGVLKKIKANHVVMACPKFVARRLLPQMPKQQDTTIDLLPYRAYLVGNIITKKPIQSPSYELYCLTGKMPPSPTAMKRGDRSFTDICFGTWAQEEKTQHSVLTLYQGIAYDGARQFLFNPASHDKYKAKYLTDIEPVLNALGLSQNDIHGVRMTRWGHALPVAAKGLLAARTAQIASASIHDVIHFANQDNWMTPCFEAAHQAAIEVSSLIK